MLQNIKTFIGNEKSKCCELYMNRQMSHPIVKIFHSSGKVERCMRKVLSPRSGLTRNLYPVAAKRRKEAGSSAISSVHLTLRKEARKNVGWLLFPCEAV